MPSISELLALAAVQGPWLHFVMAFLETSFVTGLFVPTGVALSFATGLAVEEGSSLPILAAAALAGGAIGDSLGFWIGGKGRTRWSSGSGRLARFTRAARVQTARDFGGRPLLSVTFPRLISFVRTVMPLAAGMSGLSYARYLRYELMGLAIWCALYMTMGAAAGEGWYWAARLWGVSGAAVVLAAAVTAWFLIRRRLVRGRARSR